MKKFILFVILAQLALPGMAQAEDPWKFTIMAWNATEGNYRYPVLESKSLFAGMKECGMTCPGFVGPNQLDAAWSAGMRAYVIDTRCFIYKWDEFDAETARKRFKELAAATKDHPAVIGYYLRDEPLPSYFDGLRQMIEIIREYAPGKVSHINLFPNYVPEEALGCTYREYVENFIKICKPDFLSYDFYGIYKHTAFPDPSYVRPGMWANLALFRELGQKYNLPFRVVNLATAHYDFRIPTEADFAFQAYAALAYGARGISHFTYLVPGDWDDKLGPVDKQGNRNPSWYDLAKVNKQLLNWGPLLERLKSTAVYHFPVDQPDKQPAPADSMVAAISGGRFVTGDFVRDDGKRYVMIVNCNLAEAATPVISFRTAPKSIKAVSTEKPGDLQLYQPGTSLGPGKAMLLELETK